MDITDSLAPTSDQLDAIELIGGPRTFTITGATKGSTEQPVQIGLEGFPRVWRPSKGMRRVLAAAWGTDASTWVGRSVTLFYDETVTFGKEKPGGTRISHLSHITKPLTISLPVSRGKSVAFTVEPLTIKAPASTGPTADDIAACTDQEQLRQWWKDGNAATKAQVKARKAELDAPPTDPMEQLVEAEPMEGPW